jgi:hypothetical protein
MLRPSEFTLQKTRLPVLYSLYRILKSNPKTAWLADYLKNEWFQFFFKMIALILYFLIGIAFYQSYEGWKPGISIFFTIVTMTTVGKFEILSFISTFS